MTSSVTCTTSYWKNPIDGEYYGEKDFFCLDCNGVFSANVCQCNAGEKENQRLSIHSNKSFWCRHYMMNIIPCKCDTCEVIHRKQPLYLDCDSSDEDDVWTRHIGEIQDGFTW